MPYIVLSRQFSGTLVKSTMTTQLAFCTAANPEPSAHFCGTLLLAQPDKVAGFCVSPTGLWDNFGLMFPRYAPIPFFGMRMFTPCHCIYEACKVSFCFVLFFRA